MRRFALLLAAASLTSHAAAAGQIEYPPTPHMPVVDLLHEQAISDPYRWLEDCDNEQVQAWTAKQNALTRRCLDQFEPQRTELRRQLDKLFAPNIGSTPAIFGDRFFFTKRDGLQDHAVLYVRTGGLDAQPHIVIDPNKLSADGSVSLDWWFPSPDGALVAYGTSESGSEQSTLRVRDVQSGQDRDDSIPYTARAELAWDADGGGFTYTRLPEPGSVPRGDEQYYRHIHYHELGTSWRDDPKTWGQGRAKEDIAAVSNSSDYRYQFLTVWYGWARNELFIRPARGMGFRRVADNLDALFFGDVLGDQLFIRTDYLAPRFRLVATVVGKPTPEHWQDVIPEQKGVLAGFLIADGKLVVHVMENAYSRLVIYEPTGQLVKEIELPALGSVTAISARPDRSDLLFGFESFAHPPTVFAYDLRQHTLNVHERLALDAPLDTLETKQLWCNSPDGTRVPIFVTHKKDLPLDGTHPAVLRGYGGFNINATPQFRRDVLPWLQRGGVLAVACIRGGGEFGKDWHRAAQREQKQNCFDDFLAAAEKLIADGYTSPQRLGLQGGSNGGLLVGAALVQRPDLFGAVHCAVPLLDMLRYHRFQLARLWIPEYGCAESPGDFRFLYAYSPYHHVRGGTAYPAVLLTTADHDSRVDPMHARKMAAALQAATKSDRPILLWVENQAGHTSAAKPLRQYLDDQADIWTFFMWQLGMFDTAPQ